MITALVKQFVGRPHLFDTPSPGHEDAYRAVYLAADVDPLLAELEATKKLLATPRMYPIQNGPSVRWEVMEPHEGAAQRLHSQSLARLAERGGLGTGEAWCVVNGIFHKSLPTKAEWDAWDKAWRDFAERINLHYDQLTALQARAQALREALDRILAFSPASADKVVCVQRLNAIEQTAKAALAQEAP